MDLSHSVAVSRSKGRQEVPRQGGGCEHPFGAQWVGMAAGQPPVSLVPYHECSPWLRTVGRKKRDLREEKSHTETEQNKRTTCRRGPRRGEPDTTGYPRKCLCGSPESTMLLYNPNPAPPHGSVVCAHSAPAWLDFPDFPA